MFAKGLSFFVFVTFLFILTSKAQELRLEEVVSNHTNSIGKSDKRKELKNIVLLGMSEFRSKMPERKSVGKVAIVSDASNLLVISSFLAESYPYEKIGIFDSKINIPFVNAGVRSPLGDFLWEHPGILKSGLFSGSMSLQWSFSEDYSKRGKLSLAGTKKVDGKKAHVIEFYPQGGSESLKIRLFLMLKLFNISVPNTARNIRVNKRLSGNSVR
ncbi:MAG: hypothetical protein HC846_06290 [Blastocatellia bacterium]|nr:hypothetical protein [Blastocatellia bacterium]